MVVTISVEVGRDDRDPCDAVALTQVDGPPRVSSRVGGTRRRAVLAVQRGAGR